MYRHVRHPGYLEQLLVFVGIRLALANRMPLLVLLIPIGTAFGHRINLEEKALREHFAEAYDAYRRRSWRSIPGLFCLGRAHCDLLALCQVWPDDGPMK